MVTRCSTLPSCVTRVATSSVGPAGLSHRYQVRNRLLETGIAVNRATASFQVAGKNYPAGSYVVLGGQAFRPHALDMFEPQDHPDDFPYPGAPPTPPYDVTGWTLAYQMGVQFDRFSMVLTGPFEK